MMPVHSQTLSMNRESIDRVLVYALRLLFAAMSPLAFGLFVDSIGHLTFAHGYRVAFNVATSSLLMIAGCVALLHLSFSLGDPGNGSRLHEPTLVTRMRWLLLLVGSTALMTYWGVSLFDAYTYGIQERG
jgi:hypothetical protein